MAQHRFGAAGELAAHLAIDMGEDRVEVVGAQRAESATETAVVGRLAGELLKGGFEEPLGDLRVVEKAIEQADENRLAREANLVGFVHPVDEGQLLQQRGWHQGEQDSEGYDAVMESPS